MYKPLKDIKDAALPLRLSFKDIQFINIKIKVSFIFTYKLKDIA